ncbi:MAG: S-layer homology domain-containing protein [Clostridiales bacterium]|nr:MAG: S-layer homology domain-containing protein [Clostridiales bacterium]
MEDGESYELIKKQHGNTRKNLRFTCQGFFNIWSPNGYNKFFGHKRCNRRGKKAVISLGSADILSGFGDGTFRPKENITVTETAIAALRALGYKPAVNWSTDRYLREADKIKLFRRHIEQGQKARWATLLFLLYNVLHADRIEYDYTDDKLETPLESVFKLKYIKGVLTANAYASFSGVRAGGADYVAVDNVICKGRNRRRCGYARIQGYSICFNRERKHRVLL